MPRLLRLALVLTLVSVGLSACGKRGQLDPPPGVKSEAGAKSEAGKTDAAPAGNGQTKIGGKKRVPLTVPKKDLPIDWILG
jgi:predicted small lipoprotein YifL